MISCLCAINDDTAVQISLLILLTLTVRRHELSLDGNNRTSSPVFDQTKKTSAVNLCECKVCHDLAGAKLLLLIASSDPATSHNSQHTCEVGQSHVHTDRACTHFPAGKTPQLHNLTQFWPSLHDFAVYLRNNAGIYVSD